MSSHSFPTRRSSDLSATTEIGDTPEDVSTAKAAGFRSIAVSSPRTHDRAELAGADAIVDDMDGIVRALLSAGRLS